MKISISIVDALFNATEKLAKRFGISRCDLYQRVIRSYTEQRQADCITEALDALYDGTGAESGLDSSIENLQGVSLAAADW